MSKATEFRVVSKRRYMRPVRKVYATRKAAERRIALLTDPEPWKWYGKPPDEPDEFTGRTERESTALRRANMEPLEYVRLETRIVHEWKPA